MPTLGISHNSHLYAHHVHNLQLLENNNNGLPSKESDVPECPAMVPVTYVRFASCG